MDDVVDGLDGYCVADLHPVVCEAFADYVVPMQPDEARLTELLTRRGRHPGWSAGLFHGGRLAGFWLTGRDDPDDEAYCTMAGIVPGARGRGGIDALFAHVLATLATIDARDDLTSSWLLRCGAQVKLTQDEMMTSH